ncbi:MAG: hypothetical protein KAR40_09555 [Candidatus Sabulitectum sp.]|nr:hypothetical protein [Candidatus Sabulitectum sp.]
MAYKTIEETFWIDPELKRLSFQARGFLCYLITNRHAHYSGIYYLPKSLIAEETCLTPKEVTKCLNALAIDSGKFYALYDEDRSVVWVKNMLYYQAKASNKKKILQGTAKQLKTLHGTPLIREFLECYHNEIQNWMSKHTFTDNERETLATVLTAIMPVLPPTIAPELLVKAPESPATPPKELAPTKAKEKEPKPEKKVYGEFENIKLLDEEHDKLLKRLGKFNLEKYIKKVGGYLAANKKKDPYNSHYAVILNWWGRDVEEGDSSGAAPEKPVCTEKNPMPEGKTPSSWKHPDLDKKMAADGRVIAARCNHCKQVFM